MKALVVSSLFLASSILAWNQYEIPAVLVSVIAYTLFISK